MSLAGFRKQINKANQFMTEKIGGAEGTKLDDDYNACEKKIDIMNKFIEEVVARTQEYLQPNPATRARLMTVNTFNKIQGKAKTSMYPQPEGQLGDCMHKYGTELGTDSVFGQCLVHAGESFHSMADIKYTMEDQVKDGYLEPLRGIQTVELKEISFHRKKLEGRRLDFDCKKRKHETAAGSKLPEDELKVAEEKFQESKILAETSMANFLNCDVEHIQALAEFTEAQAEYYRKAAEIMDQLQKFLIEKKDEAAQRPRVEHVPKLPLSGRSTLNSAQGLHSPSKNGLVSSPTSGHPPVCSPGAGPSCRALFDFDAENTSELQITEGEVIRLIQQVDENWYEGEVNGRKGYFPVNYVEIISPLP